MTQNTEAEVRQIYEQWHQTVIDRNLDGLMALYGENAILETPLIIAALKDKSEGILSGKTEIKQFFEAGFRNKKNGLGRWYRTGVFFANGQQLVWEYPRKTPEGNQVDLVEFMDIANGRILHHRVYWGWFGFKTLMALT